MKTHLPLRPLLFLCLLVVGLTSCERLSDKEASYEYKIENKTDATIEVVVKINDNPNVHVVGTPFRNYAIKPGDAVEVWQTSGFTTDEVYDEEKKNATLYWFTITHATKAGQPAKVYLNTPQARYYDKKSNYTATYTLVLSATDF